MYQTLELAKVVIQNGAFYVGDKLFSTTAGPMLDEYLQHYTFEFGHNNVLRGQES